MFNLAQQGVVAWPFTLSQQQGEAFVDVPVTVRFRVFTRAELLARDRHNLGTTIRKLYDLVRTQADPAEIDAVRDDMERVGREEEAELSGRIVGWSGFGDGASALDYTYERGQAVLAFEPYYQAFWQALLEASRQAKPKNSLPGADGSQAPGPTTTT